ncbi:MAG TPA: hypothetical protein VGR62_19050 [Candidatus Binatia bacterium]|jgi:hypothetical protein|nr:hypothetical protein [Candidatus Binatia bacterium]
MRNLSLALTLVVLAVAPVPVRAKRVKPQLCADGRWLVTAGSDLVTDAAAPAAFLALVGGKPMLEGTCAPSKISAKASKRGMQVVAKWKACGDVKRIVLSARATTSCTGLSGTIKAKKHKKAPFTAEPSRCSDAVTDAAAGEQCDGAACTTGQACTTSCLCDAQAVVTGDVRDVNGPLAGVLVADTSGTPSGTTDAAGHVTLTLTTGVPHALKLSKGGYADQFAVITLPNTTTIGYFESGMIARGAVQSLAATGGSLSGDDGSTLVVPAGALVDGAGNAVAGVVDVTVTPVDVTGQDLAAFPGRFEGIRDAGTRGPIASHGVVEYTLMQNGQPVELAAGQTATIEIPLYAGAHLDGADAQPGDHIALWSIDETTGIWTQSGEGTVVVSASSPTGVALQAQVPHLSWWNADIFIEDPYRPKPRCYRTDGAGGYIPEVCALGPLPYGSHYDNTAAQQARFTALVDPGLKYPPRFAAQIVVPAEGGVETPVPAGVDTVLHGCSLDGLQCGDVTVNGPSGPGEDIRIDLAPRDLGGGDGETITVGWDQVYSIDPAGEVDHFTFVAQSGVSYGVTVIRAGSLLEGVVGVAAGGVPLDSAPFGFTGTGLLVGPAADGSIDISVDGSLNEPGAYRLRLDQLATPTEMPLAIGEFPTFTVISTLDPRLDRYGLTGSAGAPHSVSLQATYFAVDVGGEAIVRSRAGTVLARAHIGKGIDTRLLYTMPGDGQAVLDVFSRSLVAGAFGNQEYTVYAEADTLVGDVSVTIPAHRQDTISGDDTVQRYRFTGTAGTFVRTIVKPVGNGYMILSRDGAAIATARFPFATFANNQLTTFLDATGEYTLDLVCEGGCSGATPFDVTIEPPSALTVDGSAHGTIAQAKDVVSYIFDVTAPGTYGLGIYDDGSLTGTDALLYGPDGQQVSNSLVGDDGARRNTLPESGRYTLDVKNSADGTGGFTVGVATAQNPVAAAFTDVLGTPTATAQTQIAVPGDLVYYTVELTSGDQLHLSVDTPRANPATADSGLRARVRLLAPNNPPFGGNLVTSATTGQDGGSEIHAENLGTPTAASTGTYVIEITTAPTGTSQLTGTVSWTLTK